MYAACGRVSVRPTQAGLAPKWLSIGSLKRRRTVIYNAKDLCEIPTGSLPTGASGAGGLDKNCVFRPVE